MPTPRQQQVMNERRAKVAAYRLGGMRSQRKIAAELGAAVSTINRDFQALDAEYRERAATDVATEKGLDLQRADRLIAAIWAQALNGNLYAVDRVLAIMAYRARVLGTFAPTKIAIEQLEEEVRRQAEELGLDKEAAVEEVHRIINETRQGAAR
jgi:DNA-binding transcriptional MocR family regulator